MEQMIHVTGGRNEHHVLLYALSTCLWCRKTKQLLENLDIDFYFTDVDLLTGSQRDEAVEMVERWNPSGSFPTMVIDDQMCITGFREELIREALR